jgi:chemotaxis signal transduction protein
MTRRDGAKSSPSRSRTRISASTSAFVREIRGWTPTTVLPHAQDYVKGVVNLRGSVVAVVDLSARLGFGPTEPSARHIIIIVMIGDQTIGLLADVVSDILTIDDTAMRQVPDIASEVARDFISNVVTFDDGHGCCARSTCPAFCPNWGGTRMIPVDAADHGRPTPSASPPARRCRMPTSMPSRQLIHAQAPAS